MKKTYTVWEPAAGQAKEDGRRFTADDPQHAAELWADWRDFSSLDFRIVGGTPATVMVRDTILGRTFEMIVSGETIRQYAANLRIKP